MARKTFWVAVVVSQILIWSALPAVAASAEGKAVKFPAGDRTIAAKLFVPKGKGPFPAVIEIHGISGRDEWDDEVSNKLTAAGYVTLSVDLFGKAPSNYYEGLKLRDQVRPHVREDLQAAMAYLRTLKEVAGDRIGALGWCMGGGYVLQLALAEPTLAAGVIYFGPVVVDEDELKNVRAPLIGFFGQEDRSIPIPAVKMMANSLKDLGNPMELYIYPDADHGFAEGHSRNFEPEKAADAWQKAMAFLRANLVEKKSTTAAMAAR
jgi:carboxymethylenebutenolidase